ncbi:MAG TPA: hypothetical protein VHZ55_14300 [Bryobacteraceae bacterium]|jgi:hypothetical protein|nr:hypothetical protein [Bryobacteraceae bacterium]
MFWRNLFLEPHQRALIAKNHRFSGILAPGEHRIFVLPGIAFEAEQHNVRKLVFRSRWSGYLLRERPDVIEEHFTKIETNAAQLAMVYLDGSLFQVMTPAQRLLLWRGEAEVTCEMIEVIPDLDSSSDLFEQLAVH